MTMDISNVGEATERLDSDSFQVLVDGQEVDEAGDLVDGVAKSLQLTSMGDMVGTSLGEHESDAFVFVYKVDPAAQSYVLQIDFDGGKKIDLAPYLGSEDPLSDLVPTAAPSSTPTSTSI
ncbi:MAG TPA: hypothetical protein VGR16_11565, partial [Thermomicrobiales bacterium]|nr:hypothetical protein [Thermomicrobiales bacterium]